MKIAEEYSDLDSEILKIEKAFYNGNYTIKIRFNNCDEKIVDFKSFLTKSQHPSIRKYLDEKLFSKFKIIDGNLNWNDYDLIFPISDLHDGKIDF